jgi:uroporphyrinogen decarboxylase
MEAIEPDWKGFCANLRRQGTPQRVYYFEHGIAENVQTALAERYDLWREIPSGGDNVLLRRTLAVHRFLGHELFRVFPPGARMVAPKRKGAWAEEGRGPVSNWEEFEAFAWPNPNDADYSVMESLERLRPRNMKAFHVVDVWEVVRDLMGFETLCLALQDDPNLITAIFEKVGGFVEAVVHVLCDFETFGVVYLGDDLGHKTGLMIAPRTIRTLVIPWHKRLARLAHAKGKLFFFHSCGDMYTLMDDYIDDVGIDAKHSFEDNVLPVTEAKKRYGDRVSLLGGVDVDILARANEETIRRRTREVLEICQPGGGYFLGSGNWVTDYIPVEHYLAMLDEARNW